MRCHTTPDHLFHQLKGSDLWKPANQDCASRWCWLYCNWHCFDLSNWLCLLKVVEGSQEEIQNLPSLPEPEPQVRPAFFVPMKGKLLFKSLLQAESPRRSPKKESPILENRKPGRPRWESFFFNFSSERFVKFWSKSGHGLTCQDCCVSLTTMGWPGWTGIFCQF